MGEEENIEESSKPQASGEKQGGKLEVKEESASETRQPETPSDPPISRAVSNQQPAVNEVLADKPAENMETHAHHLHKAPGQGWRHYLFEFFMLFLAVTLGFFVEDQREHLVEHRREKQYMRSMVEDLKSDTAALNRIIKLRTNRIKIHDSLSFLLNEPGNAAYLSDLYYFSLVTRRISFIRFINNDRTIQQLKSSGGLRLIRQNVSDSIALYDSHVKRLEQIEDREYDYIQNIVPYSYKIFDGRICYKMLDETDRVYRPAGNPALLQYTKEDLNAFISSLSSIRAVNIAYRNFSRNTYDKAVNLL